MRSARRLFAQTLEAKGGLKIYTIHGFCERLLQRFPLEADVTPHFAVLDDVGAARLRRAAFDATMARAADCEATARSARRSPGSSARDAEDYFRQVVDAVLSQARASSTRMVAEHGGGGDWAEAEMRA